MAHTLLAKGNDSHAADLDNYVAHALRAEGFDASEDGTGRGTPLVPVVAKTLTRGAESAGKGGYAGRRQEDDDNLVAFGWQNSSSQGDSCSSHIAPSLDKGKTPAVAFDMRGREGGSQFEGPHDTANIRAASGGSSRSYVAQQWAVRRLTPTECERLQGFPDGYTAVPYRGKPAADGPRYKALGNSMACNVMRWLGRRIELVESILKEKQEAA